MVLGFGSKSGKKKSKNDSDDDNALRLSPSLPEMASGGVTWPSDLVDVAAIRSTPPHTPAPGATKVSFSSADQNVAIPFHRPFRKSISKDPISRDSGRSAGPIASLYMSQQPPPSAFNAKPGDRAGTPHSSRTRHTNHSIRRRVAPAFNLMVAGAQGTGKSSLLRLLVDTADISPSATPEQRASIDQFLRSSSKQTERIDTACIEICESRFDRILLSVIDTPGLDFHEGHELKLERQLSSIMKYLDLQYADTMDEEAKVVRKSKGDQHVHLCVYMIDPDSIETPASRRSEPGPLRSSRVDVSTSTNDKDSEKLAMDPTDLRVIRRLSDRVNVLPVVARADVLTDEKLSAVKAAIRRDLHESKLEFGVFGPAKVDEEPNNSGRLSATASADESTESASPSNTPSNGSGQQTDEGFGSEESEEEERRPRPVIKLNQRRKLTRSTSRSRLEQSVFDDKRGPMSLEAVDPDSLAMIRFSAAQLSKDTPHLLDLMPFAVIMPEQTSRVRRALKAPPPLRPVSACSADSAVAQSPVTTNGDKPDSETNGTPTPTASLKKSPSIDHIPPPFIQTPRDLRNIFVRKFRWGSVDVLDPVHCDFAALRNAILSTHFKVLKTNTKEVLYEKFRTEKLLARRATRNISDEDRKRLLEDLGL